MTTMLVAASVVILITAFYKLLQYFKDGNRYFERLGINGPKPHLIWGNFPEALSTKLHEQMQRWTAEFGKNYGMFHGRTPVLVTSDLAVIHDTFLKKFSSFHSRYAHPLNANPDHEKEVSMFQARGLRWKRLRTIANPTFSVGKLKEMMPIFADSTNTLINHLTQRAQSGKEFDIYPYYKYLTGDVIARCALGQEQSIQDDTNDYVRIFNAALGTEFSFRTMRVAFLAFTFPELKRIWRIISKIKDIVRAFLFKDSKIHHILTMVAKLRKEVEMRQLQKDENHGKKSDFIQLFVEAQTEEPLEKEFLADTKNGKLEMQQMKISKKLTTGEIVQQCLLFLLAGFDTTANSLAYISYLLAKNPDAQEKLISEIDAYCADETDLTYETLQQMPYLNQVVKEGLRLFPLAAFVQARQAVADCEVGGLHVPKGLAIMVDVWSIHRDKQIWGSDADAFRPERFEPEEDGARPPLSYIPFGVGPRMCVGMRFALLEEKMAIVRVLQHFTFVATQATKLDMKLSDPGTVSPNEVVVRLEPRKRRD